MRRTIALGALALVANAPAAHAQAPNDSTLRARADSITVGDYCRTANRVLAAPDVVRALGNDIDAARTSALVLCDERLASATLLMLRGDAPARLRGVARLDAPIYARTGASTFEAMEELRRLTRSAELRPVVRNAVGDSVNSAYVRIVETAHALLVEQARDSALARLQRYERKLGPSSARLNGLEVLINYTAQRFVPGFSASPLRGPSPLEIVASYTPTYATRADRKLQAVSASEFGIRWYLFGPTFGASGWRGVLQPAYWSAGALVVSDRNGALVWPWDGHARTGAFVTWGATKLGYVQGRNGQWLVSRQVQLVPFVF